MKRILLLGAALCLAVVGFARFAIAVDCDGDCESNAESQTYWCTALSLCTEKVIHDSYHCVTSIFWDDNCIVGETTPRGGPKYTPQTYPDGFQSATGGYHCQVLVGGVYVWKFMAAAGGINCHWDSGNVCECGAATQGTDVGSATDCVY